MKGWPLRSCLHNHIQAQHQLAQAEVGSTLVKATQGTVWTDHLCYRFPRSSCIKFFSAADV